MYSTKALESCGRTAFPLKLQPQPAIVLAALLSRLGELITREAMRAEVWGEQTVVDFDANLNYCIRHLRGVLLDDSEAPGRVTRPKRRWRRSAVWQELQVRPFVPRLWKNAPFRSISPLTLNALSTPTGSGKPALRGTSIKTGTRDSLNRYLDGRPGDPGSAHLDGCLARCNTVRHLKVDLVAIYRAWISSRVQRVNGISVHQDLHGRVHHLWWRRRKRLAGIDAGTRGAQARGIQGQDLARLRWFCGSYK